MEFPLEGGCDKRCKTRLECNHICPRLCHVVDRKHAEMKCEAPCNRYCENGHLCPKKCWENCKPCNTVVSRQLPCTHMAYMKCYEDPWTIFCSFKLMKELPLCHHEIKMYCGKSPEDEKCPKECRMLLECGHFCILPCHNGSSHEFLSCKQPCQRSPCNENHKCSKLCYEDCGECQVKVIRTLPCLHEAKLKCCDNPSKAYCPMKVQKPLSQCSDTALLECSSSSEGYNCKELCQKFCAEGHACKNLCHKPCDLCKVQVNRVLSRCGHTMRAPCHLEDSKIFCKAQVERVLPFCGHKVTAHCGDDLDRIPCPKPCEKCHAKNDPDHVEYQCKKRCEKNNKNCKMNHKCGKRCFQECDICKREVEKILPCKHKHTAECHLDVGDIFCRRKVKKIIPGCGHLAVVECSAKPTVADCKQLCNRVLACGHQCRKLCSERCSLSDCKEMVTLSSQNDCGHLIRLQCNRYRREGMNVMDVGVKEELLSWCQEPCRTMLPCEHYCRGKCGDCFNGRLHQPCKEKCGRTLVCGQKYDNYIQ